MLDFSSQLAPPVAQSSPGGLLQDVIQTLELWTGEIVSALATFIAGGTLATVIVLSIMIYGYRLWFGWTEGKIGEFTGRLFVWIFVGALSTLTAFYFPLLFQFFVNGPDEAVNVILAAVGVSVAPLEYLDAIWVEAFHAVTQIFTQAGWGNFSAYLLALMIMVSSVVFLIVTFGIILMAKIMTAVLIALTPIMLLTLPFQTTKTLFERWLGALFTYALTPIIVYMIVSLLMFSARVALTAGADGWTLTTVLPYVTVCFIGFVVLLQASAAASTIGGGIGQVGAGALLAAGVGLSAALAKTGGRFASKSYDLAGGPRPVRDRTEYQQQVRRQHNSARAAAQINNGNKA